MVQLLPFGREDFAQLTAWINDENLLIKWSGNLFSFPLTHESLEWYIEDTNDPDNSDAFVYKVVDTDTGDTIGHISLGGISRKNRSGRISRVLVGNELMKGKGYCRQMVEAVARIGFETLQLHRISMGVYDDNQAALHCYQKAGFKIEGINRDVLWYNNQWHSLVEMSMLEDEWQALHGVGKELTRKENRPQTC